MPQWPYDVKRESKAKRVAAIHEKAKVDREQEKKLKEIKIHNPVLAIPEKIIKKRDDVQTEAADIKDLAKSVQDWASKIQADTSKMAEDKMPKIQDETAKIPNRATPQLPSKATPVQDKATPAKATKVKDSLFNLAPLLSLKLERAEEWLDQSWVPAGWRLLQTGDTSSDDGVR